MTEQKKILLARTDRLGDLLLTTPAIKAVRNAYPDAHIAMIVRPYAEEVLRDSPYIDEIILYDKYKKHKSVWATMGFALKIRKRGFDRAIIFHPTNRMHIISYIADIPRRIGYDNKMGFLLTDRIKNTKHLGLRHERDYALDILKALGITSDEKKLFMPMGSNDILHAEEVISYNGIKKNEKFIVIHPGASCASKIWPSERFAKLADMLIERHHVKIVIAGGIGEKDIFCADAMRRFMHNEAVSIAGKLNLRTLAALIKRSILFISNDSGPVHIAVAVGAPVIDIFGRAQPGLSPLRWGPLGANDIVMHKDVGCKDRCLAHNCTKIFACLRAISVDDVYNAVLSLKIL
jgi:lipopolysaccharide heptosyltransferase II